MGRLKLKELISKNRHTVEDVKRKREREDDRERMEMEAELEREKRSRAYERDGDWHCADPECRVINFKKNSECIRCHKTKPEKAVFWDVPEFQESSKKKKDKKEKKEKREKKKESKRDPSADSHSEESQSGDEQEHSKETKSNLDDSRSSSRPQSRSQVT